MSFRLGNMDSFGEQFPNEGRFDVSIFLSSKSGELLDHMALLELHWTVSESHAMIG
jgi:hypothetical protein